jgi:4-carboxymuconolactone decarboxylase
VDRADDSIFKLTIHDDCFIESVLARGLSDTRASGLDARAQALVRVGALVAVDAPPCAYLAAIESGLAAGATRDELVGVLIALLPSIGADRVVTAAPKLGLALGFDVDEQLERLD